MEEGATANQLLRQYNQQIVESAREPIRALSLQDFDNASYAYEVIMDRIHEFEESLDNDHEVAIKLASFGQSITMSVTDVGYSNPNTLVFYGYVGEQPATLIQHMSKLNFLLIAAEKANPGAEPRRIGFALSNEGSKNQ